MRPALILVSLLAFVSAISAVPMAVDQMPPPAGDTEEASTALVSTQDHHTLSKRRVDLYRAQSWFDHPVTVAMGVTLTALGAFGIAVGLQKMGQDKACEYVKKQQRYLQHKWDERHPDGFVPVGGQLRPINAICQKKLIDLHDQDGPTNY
ncbi:uncharacterized protein PFL1_00515 [Pseudozyma flocculosa PF-1]|uniref:Uncharacterized protein n=1 Tax=Pseudozyma flocculosa TaxID=84751 RepID=A0A5C3ERJ5_9BASI|nr:uncharacterized protein PFL1_00515 [Pseudozyma flocculosa PF-1]EPQ32319.1 hypothetical protein PFL1_00515 [Pseudozyma flocculosa PF-1]SPO34722.1 uncharacterized protein PSFLO_00193 [Pseudozyma flocculosa]